MKLLITGGCGFLGSNLAAHALKRGDELAVYDNLSRLGSAENLAWLKAQGSFTFVSGDIRNAEAVSNLVSEFAPEVIFHLAGQVAMTTSIADPRLDFETNALGTINLLEAARRHSPNATIIYSSTNKVYGDLDQFNYRETATRFECVERPQGYDEQTPLSFHSPYGCSKGAADQYMLDYARIFGMKTMVFRHSSMYGGRQFATYDQGWVGWFCQKALEQKNNPNATPFTISGNGKQVRDVLHAEDMVNLYFSALDHLTNARGRAFNIGGGRQNSLSLLELFRILEDSIGVRLKFKELPPRESDQLVFIADITNANSILGWLPRIAAPTGIGQMMAWVGTRHIVD